MKEIQEVESILSLRFIIDDLLIIIALSLVENSFLYSHCLVVAVVENVKSHITAVIVVVVWKLC